jgi:hypothetical protein
MAWNGSYELFWGPRPTDRHVFAPRFLCAAPTPYSLGSTHTVDTLQRSPCAAKYPHEANGSPNYRADDGKIVRDEIDGEHEAS